MSIGFLIGAGFSKHLGLPLATEFVHHARRCLEQGSWNNCAPSRQRAVFERLVAFSDILEASGTSASNIEDLLRHADLRRLASTHLHDPWVDISFGGFCCPR